MTSKSCARAARLLPRFRERIEGFTEQRQILEILVRKKLFDPVEARLPGLLEDGDAAGRGLTDRYSRIV